MPDEVPSRAPASFSAITALIVRQRPRGACRERRKRGQSGHEEDERFKIGGRGPRMVHERSPATLHLPSRPSNRFKMGISTSFWHVFAPPRPEIPLSAGKFCLNVPHRTHRGLPRDCSSKAHREPSSRTRAPIFVTVPAGGAPHDGTRQHDTLARRTTSRTDRPLQ